MYLSSKKEKPFFLWAFSFVLILLKVYFCTFYILLIIFVFTTVYIFVSLNLNLFIMYKFLIIKNENIVDCQFSYLSNAIELFNSLVSSNCAHILRLQDCDGFVVLTYSNPRYNKV